MKTSGIITLCSDFGSALGYAAQMKGVILSINPQARLIDIDHNIPAQNIACAALTLEQSAPYFADGSVHLAVIDPGVGSARRALIVESDRAYFVGPDNGLFDFVRRSGQLRALYEINSAAVAESGCSATFHGRDIFAPAAARLSLGEEPQNFAARIKAESLLELERLQNRESADELEGRIICADTFGNLLTSITHAELERLLLRNPGAKVVLHCGDILMPLLTTYSQCLPGSFMTYVGSGGRLEIAVNCGSALKCSGAAPGDAVRLELLHERDCGAS